jgi:hypothetical protein
MQPDRLVELVHGGEERLEGRMVERHSRDIGVDLHTERAVLDRARHFAHAGGGRGHWRLRHPAEEIIGIFLANVCKAVVQQLGVFFYLLALGQEFERRHRIGQDLRIVVELTDHLPAHLEVVDAGDFAHALADIGVAAVHDFVEEFLRDEMGIGIDAHELSSQADCFSRSVLPVQ